MTLLNSTPGLRLSTAREPTVRTWTGREIADRLPALTAYVSSGQRVPLSRHPGWLSVLEQGLGHTPYALEATRGERTVGVLPLAYVRSMLFGRFLVSLPYLNYGGAVADDDRAASALTDRAVELAVQMRVRYLELRNEWAIDHFAMSHRRSDKMHMRLDLPATAGTLWDELDAKVRNQVRKGQKCGLAVQWGGAELLDEFYSVFSHNMRDLGTPTYGRRLFAAVLANFPDRAELCVVRAGPRPAAAALLVHGWGTTEVPSASCLREYNPTCANMLMYWHLLERAVARGQEVFDFGRSSEGSPTFRFKKQWGATAAPAEWQYHLRRGTIGDMRPDNPRYRRFIATWQRMPLWLTRRLGPRIVRGIP
ncbi:MAG TPA: FemAB family XrtA/PEP-CTERM system-associated protein [Gemmataceae bacterium]|nr:FemAB family XrtA/PEP-CTERM system-associated protein [Gemmataceae bacterium]